MQDKANHERHPGRIRSNAESGQPVFRDSPYLSYTRSCILPAGTIHHHITIGNHVYLGRILITRHRKTSEGFVTEQKISVSCYVTVTKL